MLIDVLLWWYLRQRWYLRQGITGINDLRDNVNDMIKISLLCKPVENMSPRTRITRMTFQWLASHTSFKLATVVTELKAADVTSRSSLFQCYTAASVSIVTVNYAASLHSLSVVLSPQCIVLVRGGGTNLSELVLWQVRLAGACLTDLATHSHISVLHVLGWVVQNLQFCFVSFYWWMIVTCCRV